MEILAGYVSRELYNKAIAEIILLKAEVSGLKYELTVRDLVSRSIYGDKAQARAKELGTYD